ncbi:UNVERIFIED_CONTAM: hypothetical protein K2H54_023881 [Gekko kuhli]
MEPSSMSLGWWWGGDIDITAPEKVRGTPCGMPGQRVERAILPLREATVYAAPSAQPSRLHCGRPHQIACWGATLKPDP